MAENYYGQVTEAYEVNMYTCIYLEGMNFVRVSAATKKEKKKTTEPSMPEKIDDNLKMKKKNHFIWFFYLLHANM